MNIDVCFTPQEYKPESFAGYSAVVIDVLRATTSIATAFANGCLEVIPVETVAEAFAKKEQIYPEALLAGERHGVAIPGFTLGNSPLEYRREIVSNKTIIMTTTNGTMALNKVLNASHIYTVAFVNAMAVCLKLQKQEQNVVLVCAGTEGRFSLEDTLCAGLIVDRLSDAAVLADRAVAVQAMYRGMRGILQKKVMASSHARYLSQIGFAEDVNVCLEHDMFTVVPKFEKGVLSL